MKVICAGMPKTGTTSLAAGLRILGFNVFDYPEHVTIHRKQWFDLYFNGVEPDFTAMYEDVDAVTDMPSAFWFEEILKSFPDAKVILTVRDSEDVWAESLVNHMSLVSSLLPSWYRVFPSANEKMNFHTALRCAAYGSENLKMSPLYKKKYREHNDRVQTVVPADQLLVFNVKQGWQPLCEFLGCEVPSEEFPRSNVAGSDLKSSPYLMKMRQRAKIVSWLLTAILIAVVSVFILLITRSF